MVANDLASYPLGNVLSVTADIFASLQVSRSRSVPSFRCSTSQSIPITARATPASVDFDKWLGIASTAEKNNTNLFWVAIRAAASFQPATHRSHGHLRPIHDEAESSRSVAAHEVGHDAVGLQLIVDLDSQQSPCGRVQSRFPKHLGHHFAEPLEASDVCFRSLIGAVKNAFTSRFICCPMRFFANVDSKQWRTAIKTLPSAISGRMWR